MDRLENETKEEIKSELYEISIDLETYTDFIEDLKKRLLKIEDKLSDWK